MPDSIIPEQQPFAEFGGIQGLMSLFNNLFGTGGSETETTGSPEGMAAAQQLWGMLLPQLQSGDFSPEAAERDSQGAVDQIIRQMSESGNPIITGAENASGGYNSTTGNLLRNDLATRIAEAGAAKKSSIKTSYAATRQSQIAGILSLVKIIADSNRTRALNRQTEGLVNNTNARRAAAAAAAAAALKGLTGKGGNSPAKPGGGGAGAGRSGENKDSGSNAGIGAGESASGEIDWGKATDENNPAGDILDQYPDDGLSGPDREEDARQNDPNYEPGGGLTPDDPFALLEQLPEEQYPDMSSDFNLNDLGDGGLDLSGLEDLPDLGDLQDISDFDFGDEGDGGGGDGGFSLEDD